MKPPPFRDPEVRAVFNGYPAATRTALLQLRRLIFVTATQTDGVGALVETLKWRQPAYLTARPKTGSTIRLGPLKDGGYAMYFHCRSTLVADFRERYPAAFRFQGNRALEFSPGDNLPEDELKHCIALALAYHIRPRLV